MKKLLLIFLICFMLLSLTGCGRDYQEAVTQSTTDVGRGYFTTIKQWGSIDGGKYYIVYANDTKVIYFVEEGAYSFGISPLYNTDGTLQVYSE